ncbi:MAG: single-stranded-DNA-specific exonuclease RecJ [Firmicutes bacterium]|nr:single-stranded-DNA-specific exonuclease RecJ [Bacillota bacterium]
MKYIPKLQGELTPEQMAVYKEFGFGQKLSKLLFIRGIKTKEQITNYTDFSPTRLHDPFLLKGMSNAVDRIETAISKKERILIIGDYDCDGICATAILYKYLIGRRANTRYFLPNREADGYGLTIDLLEKLDQRFSPKLIITVDCGISCPDEIDFAKSLGIDCIVTDHHAIPERTPNCICINPKFIDQDYPFNELCGAGVALKVVQALATRLSLSRAIISPSNSEIPNEHISDGINEALKYVDLCALATVADIVPLSCENRIIVHQGLKAINNDVNPAITALSKSCNIFGAIKSTDISYKLGPKINASGRMGNAKRGLDLLLEKDKSKIDQIITSLDTLNKARQKLCNSITEQAEQMIVNQDLASNNIIIVHKDDWEGGVLGIVAARLVDKFLKPCIVLSKSENNIYKGSGRSVFGFDMTKMLTVHADLLMTFGGHTMASGMSIESHSLDMFIQKITNYAGNLNIKDDLCVYYDFDINASELALNKIREFDILEPIGCENPHPSFMTLINAVQTQVLSNYPNHIRFRHIAHSPDQKNPIALSFMFFDGTPFIHLMQSDMQKRVIFEFQKQLIPTSTMKTNDNQSIKAVVKGIVPVPSDDASYAICLLAYFENNSLYCIDDRLYDILNKLTVDREVFIDYYKIIKQFHGTRISNIYDFYTKAKAKLLNEKSPLVNSLDLFQFAFAYIVFREVGIITLEYSQVRINTRVATELGKSRAYNQIIERKKI